MTETNEEKKALASYIFEQYQEIAEDVTAKPNGETSIEFLQSLIGGAIPEESVTFAAYALPKRHAVWWAHECLQHIPETFTAPDEDMLKLASAWVAQPDETTRYAALDQAMACENKTPGVWVALAAGWTSGSMVPSDMEAVVPPNFLTPRALNAGVLSALARLETSQRAKKMGEFVEMALFFLKEQAEEPA